LLALPFCVAWPSAVSIAHRVTTHALAHGDKKHGTNTKFDVKYPLS
jgi:hypothetical protein